MEKNIKSIPIKNGEGAIVYDGNGAITILQAAIGFENSEIPARSIWINTYDLIKLRNLLNELNLE